MSDGVDRLVYMANQIARNFVALGHDKAAAATADHVAAFWAPRMRVKIGDYIATGGTGLDPVALAALKMLHRDGPPPSQTRATDFASAHQTGGSDAG